jgi:hypothetical protein
MNDYWTQITSLYKEMPHFMSTRQKWEQAYIYMRTSVPAYQPPSLDNPFVNDYALAIRAMMVFGWNQIVLRKDFMKEWNK